jgi:Kdo2-lipid IVA lauroyltransferase/acyltransferase
VLGWFLFSILRIRRGVTLANIQRELGLTPPESRVLARRVYRHLGTGAIEFLQIGRLSIERARAILDDGALSRIREILAEGKGMLVLSAHLGHWDLLACAAALRGLKVNVITRQIKATWLNRFWMEQRRACGVQLLPVAGSARAILAALRRNEAVAFLLDQHEPGGIRVPFFRDLASTSTALARWARISGAPVVPIFLLRQGDGFRVSLRDPLFPRKTRDRTVDLVENTALFSSILEQEIRSAPEQWLWLHRRWKPAQ